jgi:hypothetical protein
MPTALNVVSHWHYSAENVSTSTVDFYRDIDRALTAKDLPVKTERITWREGHIFSSKREYLRITYEKYVFDVGAAPFGSDFFWSWWMGTKPRLLESLPYVGFLVRYFIKPTTYYSEDTRQMFEETIHRVVLDAVSGTLTASKMSPLTAAERTLTKKQRGIEVKV